MDLSSLQSSNSAYNSPHTLHDNVQHPIAEHNMEDEEDSLRTGDFQCEKCGREFENYLDLNRHLIKCRCGQRFFNCLQEGCTKTFTQHHVMLQHHKSIHEK